LEIAHVGAAAGDSEESNRAVLGAVDPESVDGVSLPVEDTGERGGIRTDGWESFEDVRGGFGIVPRPAGRGVDVTGQEVVVAGGESGCVSDAGEVLDGSDGMRAVELGENGAAGIEGDRFWGWVN
jgi:hypothetical protein